MFLAHLSSSPPETRPAAQRPRSATSNGRYKTFTTTLHTPSLPLHTRTRGAMWTSTYQTQQCRISWLRAMQQATSSRISSTGPCNTTARSTAKWESQDRPRPSSPSAGPLVSWISTRSGSVATKTPSTRKCRRCPFSFWPYLADIFWSQHNVFCLWAG